MIIFTKHAITRMKERNVLKKDIEKVIKNPDYIQGDNNRVIVNKRLNRKTLEVVFVKENKKIIILTCYFL